LAMAAELREAIHEASASRVILIDAEGGTFCGGGDIREVAAAPDPARCIGDLANAFHEALLALLQSPAVVITAINGAVAGGGLGLVLCADVVIASDKARFLTAYDRLGVTPDSGVTALLPRMIGLARALDMTVTGREIDAATALAWGLVSRVVPHDDLAAEADTLARAIAAGPVDHLVATRRLYRTPAPDLAIRLDDEARLIAVATTHPETAVRIARFAPTERSNP